MLVDNFAGLFYDTLDLDKSNRLVTFVNEFYIIDFYGGYIPIEGDKEIGVHGKRGFHDCNRRAIFSGQVEQRRVKGLQSAVAANGDNADV